MFLFFFSCFVLFLLEKGVAFLPLILSFMDGRSLYELSAYMCVQGLFLQHKMIVEVFKWLASPIVSMYIPTIGLIVFVSDVEDVERVMTDKELFPTRGFTGFNAWVRHYYYY